MTEEAPKQRVLPLECSHVAAKELPAFARVHLRNVDGESWRGYSIDDVMIVCAWCAGQLAAVAKGWVR